MRTAGTSMMRGWRHCNWPAVQRTVFSLPSGSRQHINHTKCCLLSRQMCPDKCWLQPGICFVRDPPHFEKRATPGGVQGMAQAVIVNNIPRTESISKCAVPIGEAASVKRQQHTCHVVEEQFNFPKKVLLIKLSSKSQTNTDTLSCTGYRSTVGPWCSVHALKSPKHSAPHNVEGREFIGASSVAKKQASSSCYEDAGNASNARPLSRSQVRVERHDRNMRQRSKEAKTTKVASSIAVDRNAPTRVSRRFTHSTYNRSFLSLACFLRARRYKTTQFSFKTIRSAKAHATPTARDQRPTYLVLASTPSKTA